MTTGVLETRFITGGFETRKKEDGSVILKFPLQRVSHPIYGLFYEKFASEAFDEDLASEDPTKVIAVDINHDPHALPLARSMGGKGTLKVSRDEDFVMGEFSMPKTRADVTESMERGDMDGVSIAFIALDEEVNARHNGLPLRLITRASLHRFTLCYDPAYPDSEVGHRSKDSVILGPKNSLNREDYIKLLNKFMGPKPADDGHRALKNLIDLRLKFSKSRG